MTTTWHRRVAFGHAARRRAALRAGALADPVGMTGYLTPLPGGGLSLGTGAADDLPEDDAVALTAGYL